MPFTPPVHWTPRELRLWRAAHDLTMAQAAALFGVHPASYNYWERTREPRDIDERMANAELARLKTVDPRILPGESLDAMRRRLAKEELKNAKRLAKEAAERHKAQEKLAGYEERRRREWVENPKGLTWPDWLRDRLRLYSGPAFKSIGAVAVRHNLEMLGKLLEKELGR